MLRYPPTRMSNILPEVVRLLSEWGAKVDVIYPEEQLVDLSKVRVEHDLYILKAKTELALSLAGVLHAAGAAFLNPYPVSMTLHDKIMTFHVLQAAGLPTPETYVASHPDQLTPLLDEGPLVVKPYNGSDGKSGRVGWGADEPHESPPHQGTLFSPRHCQPPRRGPQ